MLAVVGAAAYWTTGSVAGKRLPLPQDPQPTTAVELLADGAFALVLALAAGRSGPGSTPPSQCRVRAALSHVTLIGAVGGGWRDD